MRRLYALVAAGGLLAAGCVRSVETTSTPTPPPAANSNAGPTTQTAPENSAQGEQPGAELGATENAGGPRPVTPESPLGQFQAITTEFAEKMQAFLEKYQNASSPEEKRDLVKQFPSAAPYVDRAVKLAETHAADPVAFDALAWTLTVTPDNTTLAGQLRAVEQIVAKHLDNENLADTLGTFAFQVSDPGEALLRAVAEKATQPRLQGLAHFNLARMLKAKAAELPQLALLTDEQRATLRDHVGAEAFALREKANPDDVRAEAEKIYAIVNERFADVESPTGEKLGELVAIDLNELKNLSIGAVAPEITGVDVDDKPMKLSDFRGKVVVLDFWGHW